MSKISIPHDAFVFVGDGRKALFLRNAGDERFLNLTTERVVIDDNPLSREQGTDQPGRAYASVGPRRSSVEQTDWHELEEQRFIRSVAAALNRMVRDRKVKALVIAAPPRVLAALRRAVDVDVRSRIVAELDKDLTKKPLHAIEKHLAAACAAA